MADDITLTVHVRDMTRGEFQRLDRELSRLRRDVRQLGQDGNGAGERMNRLDQSLGAVQGRMRRLHQTGQLTSREMQHMKQSLSLLNREALNAVHTGEITRDQYNQLRNGINSTRNAFDHLNRDLNLHRTRLRQTGNAAQNAAQAAQRLQMAQDRLRLAWVRSQQQAVRLTQTQQRLDIMRQRAADQAQANAARIRQADDRIRQADERLRLAQQRMVRQNNNSGRSMRNLGNQGTMVGKMFGNMRAKLIGLAVVLIASLLPTIGALAPMLAGIGAIAGVVALAFWGIHKPVKQQSENLRNFLKGLKPLKKEFDGLQKTAQNSLLPSLTKSFGDIGKAMKSMNPVIKIAGKSLGDLVGKVARGISSKDFMGPFLKNVKMGTKWLGEFLASFGKFTIAFFEFGTKSQPALNAWQDLLGGFMDRGLPGMFKSMESGIGGASDYLLGLSSLINDGLLPGLGKLIGKFMQAFGPTIGKLLRGSAQYFNEFSGILGDVFVKMGPAATFVGNLVDSLMDLSRINFGVFFDTLKEIGGALLQTFTETFSGGDKVTGPLKNLSTWVRANEGPIRDAFTSMGRGFIDMTETIIKSAPYVLEAIGFMVKGSLTLIGSFVSMLAATLGDIPGIGEKFKNAKKNFDEFSTGVKKGIDEAIAKSKEFKDKGVPNLERAKLKLDVDEAKRKLDDYTTALKDPTLTKERKAQLRVGKEQAERDLGFAQWKLDQFDHKKAAATIDANAAPFFNKLQGVQGVRVSRKVSAIDANASPFFGKLNAVRGASAGKKSVPIGAATGGFWSGVRGLVGKVLGTSYINVAHRVVDSQAAPMFHNANGSVMKFFANGGTENHVAQIAPAGSWRVWGEPETGGESYIPLSPAKRTRSRRIAEDTVGILGGEIEWFAKGGHRSHRVSRAEARRRAKAKAAADAEKQARNDAVGDLTISHFGKMAGYKNDEFRHALGLPDSLGSLVDSLNKWRGVIMKATHGATEKGLLKQLDKAGKALIGYEKKLTKVNASLDKAKTNLDNLKQAAASLRDSVTSNVMSATDITKVASNDKNVTMSDIMRTMTDNVAKSTSLSDALTRLKARGVSGDIISQIAQAGIEGGGLETAGALLTASDSDIKKLNEMQKEINKAAKASGKTAADAMYAAGIKAAEGLVKGLEKKKKAIEDAMMEIAKGMEKAIKKALGIKSPSRVMQEVGHYTAEGFAVGIKKNTSTNSAWESMLNTNATSGSGGSGGQQIIQFYIGNKMIDEVVLDSSRRVVRTRGGNVQAVFGRKNG